MSYFLVPISWMIEVVVILSGVVGYRHDFFIILILLLANAWLGAVRNAKSAMPLTR